MTETRFAELRESLGLHDVPDDLLHLAFTHRSYAREQGLSDADSNQRLEYLGDAVLDLILAAHLYDSFPGKPEGDLTRLKAAVVRKSALASIAKQLSLGRYILLGRGEESTGGRRKASLLADAVEALVGALFLAGGFERAQEFVLEHFSELLEDVEARDSLRDHKSALQEILQARALAPPRYRVIRTDGPPHDRWFVVEAVFEGNVIGTGEGSTKRAAEQVAAEQALASLEAWLKE